MKAMKKKLGKNGGFTLIEMLIVVAIIAILIAISIPLINNALERARDATDQANERAAKAEATLIYMAVVPDTGNAAYQTLYTALTTDGAYYDAVNGNLLAAKTTLTVPYGKCTGCNSASYENSSANHTKQIIKIAIDPSTAGTYSTDSMYTITWENAQGVT